MFFDDKSGFGASLAKGRVTDEVAVGAVVVRSVYALSEDRMVRIEPAPDALPAEPPDTAAIALWDGVSVTVSGRVLGPARPPYRRDVSLRVGDTRRGLAVFGDRVWERSGAALTPSEPQAFDAITLSFARAFGGAFEVPSGVVPGSDMPHPGFAARHAANPGGVGYHLDEAKALGAPLPNIERPSALLSRWNDAPEPAGFSPCPDLTGWRLQAFVHPVAMRQVEAGAPPELSSLIPASFRLQHHAPPDLVFDDVAAGTAVEVDGLEGQVLRFAVPAAPTRAAARGKAGWLELPAELRVLHVDASLSRVVTVHHHAFRYHPARAPARVAVKRSEATT